jgi:hypothetical protein
MKKYLALAALLVAGQAFAVDNTECTCAVNAEETAVVTEAEVTQAVEDGMAFADMLLAKAAAEEEAAK